MTHRILGGLALALLLWVSDAAACSCGAIEGANVLATAVNTVELTDAVFVGRVVAIATVLATEEGAILRENEKDDSPGFVQRLVAIRVEEIFKGQIAPLTLLVTGGGGGDCGYPFEEGKEYLVFARLSSEKSLVALTRSTPVPTASFCSLTQLLPTTGELLPLLRKKFPPKKPVWVSWR